MAVGSTLRQIRTKDCSPRSQPRHASSSIRESPRPRTRSSETALPVDSRQQRKLGNGPPFNPARRQSMCVEAGPQFRALRRERHPLTAPLCERVAACRTTRSSIRRASVLDRPACSVSLTTEPRAYTDSAVLGATDMIVSLGPGKSPTTLRLQPSGWWHLNPLDIRWTSGRGYSRPVDDVSEQELLHPWAPAAAVTLCTWR